MTEEELLEFCRNYKTKNRIISSNNWTAEVYSFGKHIRDYGFYPSFLTINIYTDHSPADIADNPFEHELKSKAAIQFYHNLRTVKEFKKISTKPCYTLYSPFVFYRRKNKIEINHDAKGTLAFPAHSTSLIHNLCDWNIYIKQLKDLPEKFQPISICLHMHDIEKGLHKIFMENGFDVFTAGNIHDDRFAERFYDILKKFRYSTSNLIGAYTYYTIEMNIPFFIYGESPIYYNQGDANIEFGAYTSYKKNSSYIFAENLFKEITTNITKKQKDYVEECLGMKFGVSRLKMSCILYSCFFTYIIKSLFLFATGKSILSFIKKFLKILKNFTRPIRRKIKKILWKKK